MADTAYTTGSNLSGAEEAGIELIGPTAEVETENNPAIRADLTLPVPAESIGQLPINPQTKRFDKSAFICDEQTDRYYCPAGKPLPHRTTEQQRIAAASLSRDTSIHVRNAADARWLRCVAGNRNRNGAEKSCMTNMSRLDVVTESE
ncbi:MAG: hypothetical protein U0892_10590 [Pirellulales bacterium]